MDMKSTYYCLAEYQVCNTKYTVKIGIKEVTRTALFYNVIYLYFFNNSKLFNFI